MACFLVSAAEAAVVTAAKKSTEKKEAQASAHPEHAATFEEEIKVPFSKKLKWLSYMLWGGAGLLAFEHVWHGEIVAWFPFLSEMADPADASAMFREIATTGVAMAVLITLVWGAMCKVSDYILRRDASDEAHKSAA